MKPSKLDVCRATLLKGSTFVHLDPSTMGTLVPYRLRFQSQVVLQFGLDMPVPIPDMKLDQAGISGTLSFKGVPFSCFVPGLLYSQQQEKTVVGLRGISHKLCLPKWQPRKLARQLVWQNTRVPLSVTKSVLPHKGRMPKRLHGQVTYAWSSNASYWLP